MFDGKNLTNPKRAIIQGDHLVRSGACGLSPDWLFCPDLSVYQPGIGVHNQLLFRCLIVCLFRIVFLWFTYLLVSLLTDEHHAGWPCTIAGCRRESRPIHRRTGPGGR
jgi:hypothetical protein